MSKKLLAYGLAAAAVGAAMLGTGLSAAGASSAPTTITVDWRTTNDPAGKVPGSPGGPAIAWPQSYLATVPACAPEPYWVQEDVWNYATPDEKQLADSLIKGGTLSLDKNGVPSDAPIFVSDIFKLVPKCETSSSSSPSTSTSPSPTGTPSSTTAAPSTPASSATPTPSCTAIPKAICGGITTTPAPSGTKNPCQIIIDQTGICLGTPGSGSATSSSSSHAVATVPVVATPAADTTVLANTGDPYVPDLIGGGAILLALGAGTAFATRKKHGH